MLVAHPDRTDGFKLHGAGNIFNNDKHVEVEEFMKFGSRMAFVVVALLLVGSLVVACATGATDTSTAVEEAETTQSESEAGTETEDVAETEEMTETGEMTADEAVTETASSGEASASEGAESAQGAVTLAIVSEQSEARFYIDEVLLGSDKTVVGTTSDVTGAITVDPADPASASVGVIEIDPSTLVTDDDRRTRTLGERILQVASYPTITFEPTAVTGLPETVTVGETFDFQVTGNLTILDTTQEETFDMTVTPVSQTEVQGTGTTTILYADYGINIPSVPMVASVEDEVILEIEFVAAE